MHMQESRIGSVGMVIAVASGLKMATVPNHKEMHNE